jgi:prepilin-type N-terminal cleavage/methylation domain-containing protein
MPTSQKLGVNKFSQSGFGLIELVVVAVIIGTIYTIVSFQITKEPIFRSRDDVRKTDINAIANAYTIKSIDKNIYQPLISSDFGSGKVPTPPEGGQYQGLLTESQEYFFICAQLEKGKDLNCLLNSENINCYCRKSHIKDGFIPTPTPVASFSPVPSPTGIGTSSPGPSPTFSPTPSPTPAPCPGGLIGIIGSLIGVCPTPTPQPTPGPGSTCSIITTDPGTCSFTPDCKCPSNCAAGSDADCCTQKGYQILQANLGDTPSSCAPGCYPTTYTTNTTACMTCSPVSDNACPNWCSAGSDKDCCTNAGYQWIDGYGCYEKSATVGSCSWTSDGTCQSNCSAGSDADCCTQKGYKVLMVGWSQSNCSPGCYPTDYTQGTTACQTCSGSTSDNACPNWCSAGSDKDCCTNAGKCWGSNGCDTCGGVIGTCSWTANGICPSNCAAGSDADCCTQKGYQILQANLGDTPSSCAPGCYPTTYTTNTTACMTCSPVSDNACPNWCSAGSDKDCCINSGKKWFDGYGCY